MRDFFSPGRSPVAGRRAAVASSHPLATSAAIEALGAGGNAVDAAVTAMATMCVVEPQSVGLGGDCFALVSREGATPPIAFNGSGRSPLALDIEATGLPATERIPEDSVHAVTIPGAVDADARLLADHGTFSLGRALAPALRHAQEGFPVFQRVADEWTAVAPKLRGNLAARNLLLHDDRAPAPGDIVRFEALAGTLRTIAQDGADAFYRGPLAGAMVRCLRAQGGLHADADFAAHRGEYVEPLSSSYRGYDVWQIPPNGQGVTVLLMLNILENLEVSPLGSADFHRRLAEATRAAFVERDGRIADPDHAHVDVGVFLDKAGAARIAAGLSGERAAPAPAAVGDTAYVAVVDRDRNVVSLISSLFEGFGSGIVDPQTGVVFHNRGSGFSLDPHHPNALAPGKRPLHTIIPAMVSRSNRMVMPLGVTGGPFQPVGQSQIISAILDHGLDVQAAIDLPRSFLRNGRLALEPALSALAPDLAAAGFDVTAADAPIGGAHAIWIDWEKDSVTGGSDGRKDGCALAM